jgi:hypothetical protein
LADPPGVGDCVVAPPEAQEYPPVLVIGPCTTDRYGEVVSVFPHSLDQFSNPAQQVDPSDPSSVESACERTGMRFLGVTVPMSDGPSNVAPTWFPSASIAPTISSPSPLAQRFGADWVACVVLFYSVGDDSVTPAYQGSLHSVFATLDFPPSAADCWADNPTYDLPRVPCDQPHGAEEFGTVWDVDPRKVAVADLVVSCGDFVTTLTGLTDPTAGGALRVSVVRTSTYSYDDSDRTVVSYTCFVHTAPGRSLTGPLLNLQGGTVPLR